ncbi:MAG: PIN domain-containing protein [Candidatus Binatia bacterium]
MASADRTYVDPSALRCLYLHDDRSRSFCAWRSRLGGSLGITRHGYAELVNAIALAAFRGDVATAVAVGAIADVDDDLTHGRLRFADVPWRRALDTAAALSRRYTPTLGTRSLDVLHVASAITLRMTTFVAYDDRQAKLAAAVGLKLAKPSGR